MKRRYNPAAVATTFKANLKEMFSARMVARGVVVAVGGVLTPVVSSVTAGLVNRARPGTITATGPMTKGIDLLSAAVLATLTALFTKRSDWSELMLLGGMSAVMNDIASETVLPAFGLSEYLSPKDIMAMSDYLQLPPGLRDYLQLPPGMKDYPTKRDLGLRDWASVESMRAAGSGSGSGEAF